MAVSTPGSMPVPVPHWGLALCRGSACLPFSITRAFSGGLEEGPPQGRGPCIFGERADGVWRASGRQELCPAPLARTLSPRPELFALLTSRARLGPPPPSSSQSRARLGHQTPPVASHFSRGKHSPTGGPTLPRHSFEGGSQEAKSKWHGG